MTQDDLEPKVTDRRSGSGQKIVPPEIDFEAAYANNPFRIRNYRWAPGQDPNDDEAWPDSNWDYVNLEVLEHPDESASDPDWSYRNISGSPSGVRCFHCRNNDYLIVDVRSSEEIAKTQDDVLWARVNNREVDPLKVPDVLALFCPGCKHQAQVRKEVVQLLASKAAKERGR